MIIEEAPPQAQPNNKWFRRTKYSSLLAVVMALAVVAALSVNAMQPSQSLVLLASTLALVSALLGLAAVVSGGVYVYQAKPGFRRPLAFVFVVALAVFAAHMYIVDSPSATTRSTVSGPANGAFGDSHL
ncbi:MAG: hypothetical protein OK404_03090, partial [Thaumarchaeota archaeon]|nr:hypothetical protein [Nitrososphaerota archaeon]